MAVRSTPFWGVAPAINATVTLYTVPADRTALCRLWTVTNNGAGPALVHARISIGGAAARHWSVTIPASESREIPCPVILTEGNVFSLITPPTHQLVTCGYGSLLFGDPS